MNEHQIDAMEAIFELCEAMSKGNMSLNDLTEVIRAAVSEGHDMMAIQLSMAAIAASKVSKERNQITIP